MAFTQLSGVCRCAEISLFDSPSRTKRIATLPLVEFRPAVRFSVDARRAQVGVSLIEPDLPRRDRPNAFDEHAEQALFQKIPAAPCLTSLRASVSLPTR